MDQINERLKEMRLNAGMSQEELASKLNVSRQSVSKWETGDSLPDILKLKQLSKLYDVSIDYIVGILNLIGKKIRKKQVNKLY